MLCCREISKLVSESMEQKLPLRVRMQLWMHLAMCRWCLGFARHAKLFRHALRAQPERLWDEGDNPDVALSPEARERLKSLLGERD